MPFYKGFFNTQIYERKVKGFVIIPVVSVFTKKLDKDLIDEAFSCYEEQVSVHKKMNLGN